MPLDCQVDMLQILRTTVSVVEEHSRDFLGHNKPRLTVRF
jgi:hypothetical protein